MATLWEKIKAYFSGWPIGGDAPEPEPEPKKKKSTAKKPKGLNPKKKKAKSTKGRKQGNIA